MCLKAHLHITPRLPHHPHGRPIHPVTLHSPQHQRKLGALLMQQARVSMQEVPQLLEALAPNAVLLQRASHGSLSPVQPARLAARPWPPPP